jgi:uncharacterized membrane protein YphA (DoxX/SURF4 family)
MSTLGIAVGVMVGIVAAGLFAIFLFQRSIGNCFFEQGCGPNENLTIVGIVLAAALMGGRAGWLSARLIERAAKRGGS